MLTCIFMSLNVYKKIIRNSIMICLLLLTSIHYYPHAMNESEQLLSCLEETFSIIHIASF